MNREPQSDEVNDLHAAAVRMAVDDPADVSRRVRPLGGDFTASASRPMIASFDFRKTTGSTNDDAKAWIASTAPLRSIAASLPRLHIAGSQTQGRGRHGRRWFSDHRTLTFSIIVDGERAHRLGPLSLAVGTAIADSVSRHLPGNVVQLKWPNDVWIQQRKLAGVLIERPSRDSSPWVIGVGINIGGVPTSASALEESRSSGFEREGPPLTASMSPAFLPTAFGTRGDWLQRLVASILRYADPALTTPEDIARQFDSRCALRGRPIRFEFSGNVLQGQCLGVRPDGGLRVDVDGHERTLFSGEVQRIRPDDGFPRNSNR